MPVTEEIKTPTIEEVETLQKEITELKKAKESVEAMIADMDSCLKAVNKQYNKLFNAYAELFNKYLAE